MFLSIIITNMMYAILLDNEAQGDKFIKDANDGILGETTAFVQFELDEYECADGAWLFRSSKSDQVFALFVDCKSAAIKSSTVKSDDSLSGTNITKLSDYAMRQLPKNGKQAQRLLDIAKRARSLPVIENNSLAEALSSGRFLYVYINTNNKDSFSVGDNIIHLGRKHSDEFLSFFRDFYILHRSSSNAANTEREEITRREELKN